jgi:hypothetical protein
MEAGSEEVLGELLDKQVYDLRGKQTSIGRLLGFDKEAFIHMLFYRVLIIVSIIAAIAFVLGYAIGIPSAVFKLLFVLVWVLFTPQVYETAKGISVIATKGFVFGHLNKSYLATASKHGKRAMDPLYKLMPYTALVLWLAGLAALSYLWLI